MPTPRRLPLAVALMSMTCLAFSFPAKAEPLESAAAAAEPTTRQNPTPGETGAPRVPTSPAPGEPGFKTGLFSPSRSNLLGDAWGLRTALGNYGISLGLQETSEVFGNATGGIHQGVNYNGLTMMSLGLDTAKAFGWEGGTFNISALQIHGRSLTADNLQVLQTTTGIEASRATRLWELWYQQEFADGLADVKIGQQSVDQEFMNSTYSGLFLNAAMGWPLTPSVNLYAGGPAYPLSSLGIRLRAHPTGNITVLGGVFDDNPPGGPYDDDSQLRGAAQSGTAFNLRTGALFIAELQYALNQPANGEMERPGQRPAGLPGTYKVGFLYDSGSFPDRRYDSTGSLLASPASNGNPLVHHGSYGIYGVMDQLVWRSEDDDGPALGVFARVTGAPGGQNLASFSLNTGFNLKAPFSSRPDDTFGIGYGFAKLSDHAVAYDEDVAAMSGTFGPVRSSESFIEVTYQAQLAPWWQVQPDFQYVFTPGGGATNPLNPAQRIGNEAIFGLRTNITF